MFRLHVRAAVDLREEPSACKKAAKSNVVNGIAAAPLEVRLQDYTVSHHL